MPGVTPVMIRSRSSLTDRPQQIGRTRPEKSLRVCLLGASGRVGRQVLREAVFRGYELRCQTRNAAKLADEAGQVQICVFEPLDARQLELFVQGSDVVVMALGTTSRASTELFSKVTKRLIAAMQLCGVPRLIAITGVGAGETRGHGGFVYDRIIYPLFTKNRYRDKEIQEELIAASNLDWIIVRPAPFTKSRPQEQLEVHIEIGPDTMLRRITPGEVAEFVVGQFESDQYLHQRPFIGHP